MRRSEIKMPKTKSKKIFWIIVVFVLIVTVASFKSRKQTSNKNADFRVGIVTDKSVEMVSISPARKMINVAKISDPVPLWLPEEGKWIKVADIKTKLQDSQTKRLVEKIFWFNFGFVTDNIIFSNDEEAWRGNGFLIKNLGFTNWLKFKLEQSQMLFKEEEVKNDLVISENQIDEMMIRDFADNNLVNDDIRLSVFNSTSKNGVANFMARRLEWSGFSVVSTENTARNVKNCMILYGPKTDSSFGWKTLTKLFDCDRQFDENLNENEAELYFGENYVSMVKYSSYKQSQ
jgi:hypothetical protein